MKYTHKKLVGLKPEYLELPLKEEVRHVTCNKTYRIDSAGLFCDDLGYQRCESYFKWEEVEARDAISLTIEDLEWVNEGDTSQTTEDEEPSQRRFRSLLDNIVEEEDSNKKLFKSLLDNVYDIHGYLGVKVVVQYKVNECLSNIHNKSVLKEAIYYIEYLLKIHKDITL